MLALEKVVKLFDGAISAVWAQVSQKFQLRPKGAKSPTVLHKVIGIVQRLKGPLSYIRPYQFGRRTPECGF